MTRRRRRPAHSRHTSATSEPRTAAPDPAGPVRTRQSRAEIVTRAPRASTLACRELHEEAAAVSRGVGDDVAVDAPRQPPREREPETRSLLAVARCTAPHAGLEDAVVLASRDPGAVVFDGIDDAGVLARDRRPHMTRAVATRVL